jgi:hypothetical protein
MHAFFGGTLALYLHQSFDKEHKHWLSAKEIISHVTENWNTSITLKNIVDLDFLKSRPIDGKFAFKNLQIFQRLLLKEYALFGASNYKSTLHKQLPFRWDHPIFETISTPHNFQQLKDLQPLYWPKLEQLIQMQEYEKAANLRDQIYHPIKEYMVKEWPVFSEEGYQEVVRLIQSY